MSDLTTTLLDLAALPARDLPEGAMATAQASLCDWLVCGRAGMDEPVANTLRNLMAAEGGKPVASVFGAGQAPARMAALVNGTISHALDFDDTHFAHVGHLSVGVYPAALAAGEATGASASDVVAAFLLGSEGAIRVGQMLGTGHYNRGFHQTATAGAFGATIAAGRLLGLTRDEMRVALALCSTRASGLRSQFGTMGKPYNAGLAAANGVEAAQLAKLGMGSCADGLMGAQGFVATHTDEPGGEVAPPGAWLMPANSYKFHACCHGTHAMIEALLALMPLDPAQVTGITLQTSPRWMSVCNIPTPASGLEVKFSYAWLAAMVLRGYDTSAFASYTQAVASDAALARIAARVEVIADAQVGDMQARGHVTLADGKRLDFAHDLACAPDPEQLLRRLSAKARGLLGDQAAALEPVMNALSTLSAADLGQIVRARA